MIYLPHFLTPAIQMGRPSRYQRPQTLKNSLSLTDDIVHQRSLSLDDSTSSNNAMAEGITRSGSLSPMANEASETLFSPMLGDTSSSSGHPESCSSSKAPTLCVSLLGQSLEVCHTDVSSIGIGQQSEPTPLGDTLHQASQAFGQPMGGQQEETQSTSTSETSLQVTSPSDINTDFHNKFSKPVLPLVMNKQDSEDIGNNPSQTLSNHSDQHSVPSLNTQLKTQVPQTEQVAIPQEPQNGPQDGTMISAEPASVDIKPTSDEALSWTTLLSPSSVPQSPSFSPEDVFQHGALSPQSPDNAAAAAAEPPPLNTSNFPPNWPKCLTPTKAEVAKMFRWDYWKKPAGITELILVEEHQALIDHLVTHQKEAMEQTVKANEQLKKDMEVPAPYVNSGHILCKPPLLCPTWAKPDMSINPEINAHTILVS